VIDAILRRAPGPRPAPTTPGASPTPPPTGREPTGPGYRFVSSTPFWFERSGSVYLWNNHAPSAYGIWPLARAVARTGGRYVFYPFPASRWLDVCPADYGQLDRLAPELVPPSRYLSLREGDAALEATCRAVARVTDVTPWADTVVHHRAASGWSAFAHASPLTMQPDWFVRRSPFDDPLDGSQDEVERLGRRVAEETLPAYDEALRWLDGTIPERAEGRLGRSHPRSVADLYLTRFWLSMSAFHLEAFSIYAREVERFVPAEMKGRVDHVLVTYVPTIRMSDCLDAYDGRTLTREQESAYPRWTVEDAPGYQGNLLEIPVEDANYRAKRSLDLVLLHLDPRLRRRALDMLRSARDVMSRYGRTGWGWSVYYADAVTFIFKPVPVATGHRPTPGGSERPPPPTTPRGPNTPSGGSNPGGPTTGR
jgi:hypothetical protein